jgi:hypothetical protein
MYYLCYDAALNDINGLLQLQSICEKNICLFADTADKDIWYVAPWIMECSLEQYQQIVSEQLPVQYSTLFQSSEYLKDIVLHLQYFIYHTTEGKFCRVWDARILQHLLAKMPATYQFKFFALFKNIFLLSETDQYTQLGFNARQELVIKELKGNPYLNL